MKATRRHLWRRAAALTAGVVVGFLCISALRRTPYDPPRARRLQEWDGEKVGPDGPGVRPLRCFQGYQQIQGGGHWTQGAVVHNASLPTDGSHLDLADHALLLSNARVRPVSLAATDEAALIKSCSATAARNDHGSSILVLLPPMTRGRRRKDAPRSRRPRRLGLLDLELLARVGRIRGGGVGRRAGARHEQLRDGVDACGLGGPPPPGERVEARLRPAQALVGGQGRELFRGRRLALFTCVSS